MQQQASWLFCPKRKAIASLNQEQQGCLLDFIGIFHGEIMDISSGFFVGVYHELLGALKVSSGCDLPPVDPVG